jgi:hypothetical protein
VASVGSPWRSLEQVAGLCALPVTWRARLGEHYEAFKAAFLQSRPDRRVRYFPCPNGCPSWHEVFDYGPQEIVAACRCESSRCQDLVLTVGDIVPLEVSWLKLARALCQAFGFAGKLAPIGIPHTRQIGAWSAEAVPVFLTIQTSRQKLRLVVAELVARLRQPFILLAPSLEPLEVRVQELLANIGARCFSLAANVRLGGGGTLLSDPAPGDLFARFAPSATRPVAEDEARAAFGLIRMLEAELTTRKAPVYTVFRLYCVEGLSPDQVARKCCCARSLVYARLERLRQKLGRDPAELRQFSTQFERIEESLADPRARRIYRKGAVYGDETSDGED